MIVNKIVIGYVLQKIRIDMKGNVKFLSQEFIAGDDPIIENVMGEQIDNDAAESAFLPYEMKQPEEIA